MRPFALAFLLALAGGPTLAQPASSWAAHQAPSAGPARVIGTTALGCLAGGEALPPEGPAWQAVRLSRNRNWGHPETIRGIRTLAQRARSAGLPDLLIGDVAQPRGGPMPFGHASHQSGLDFDVWLDVNPRPPLSRAQREDWPVASLVLPDQSGADPNRFTAAHARLIRLAAELPNVDRVLVNHGIKRSLCTVHGGEAWLRRVRPWRGHDSHMHVRLRCPAGSPECQEGPPIPAGDGCDASLDWWLSDEARRPPSPPRAPGPPPALPPACGPVFRAR
ncbi:penicillin-insensitive murein endopeptidase [Sabulicella glaciei]|uniref:Penicillin-insensitive murein endopeptidase n=1 Tax=Sabulicella glaciei TaxID=2984948 RepID=A0ABT3NR43_9PROT|nr:penicillin-insensitive murein endopeptidase [Roseococcus sp. MDT2-1-1]MCW8084630.1 penicillin-insensitive murein endopeptidase [Roseococcus sp. MDT2-1-1]